MARAWAWRRPGCRSRDRLGGHGRLQSVGLHCRTSDRTPAAERGVTELETLVAKRLGREPRAIGTFAGPSESGWDEDLRDGRGCLLEAGGQVEDALTGGNVPVLLGAECSIGSDHPACRAPPPPGRPDPVAGRPRRLQHARHQSQRLPGWHGAGRRRPGAGTPASCRTTSTRSAWCWPECATSTAKSARRWSAARSRSSAPSPVETLVAVEHRAGPRARVRAPGRGRDRPRADAGPVPGARGPGGGEGVRRPGGGGREIPAGPGTGGHGLRGTRRSRGAGRCWPRSSCTCSSPCWPWCPRKPASAADRPRPAAAP